MDRIEQYCQNNYDVYAELNHNKNKFCKKIEERVNMYIKGGS